MQKGQAVPFILIDENINNKQVEYSFKIHPKAHQVFNSDAVRNKKVAIAAVAGPQRTGKSFLSNRLLKRMAGFAIGPTTMPCTKGLWIWGEPIKISEDTVLIIMDTQGLNSVQRDVNVDLKIFSLSILLSSVFIYNSIGHIDQKALQNMSYVLRISQNIKISSDNQSQNQISKFFPYFYWVLRDFSLDLKGMTQNEYLQESLKPISNDEKDARNQIRTKIRKLFSHRRCQCFPRPILQQSKLAHIEQLQYDQLRQNFKQKMRAFERTFFSNLPVKTINNKPLTGSIFLNLAYQYVNAMNSGKVPKIMNSLQSVIASEVRKVCDSYKSNYKNAMDGVTKDKMPMQEAAIQSNHKNFIQKIQQKLNEKFKIWGDVQVVLAARTKLFQQLNQDFQQRVKQNTKLAEISANRSLLKLFQQIALPQIKSSQQITLSMIPEKQQEFATKYQQYMTANKTQSKYVVFTKKFPTIIFDYFGKLIARIKGVYTDEINVVKMESKNYKTELECLKRLMQQQEKLIIQKQKEVQAICDERDFYKRQLKKNQQLSAFQKQSEKMSKNQVKKNLDDFKRQVLELQNQKQQLLQENRRLKNQSNQLRSNNNIRQKQIQSTKDTDRNQNDTQNLPTQLVQTLIELRGKLSVMNEFYEKKAKDETLDQYMNRQIEQYRTDKYQSIQKVKQQCRQKIEQYRHKIQKLLQTHEKQLNMINLHLDDIKKQNIQLRKTVAQNPGNDQKTKGFIAQKKKFEQSIRMKQNHLNSQISLNSEKQRQIQQLRKQKDDICVKLAQVSAEKANLDSFKGSFWYLLRESMNYAMNKGNRLKHAIKPLDKDDLDQLSKTFNDVGLKSVQK